VQGENLKWYGDNTLSVIAVPADSASLKSCGKLDVSQITQHIRRRLLGRGYAIVTDEDATFSLKFVYKCVQGEAKDYVWKDSSGQQVGESFSAKTHDWGVKAHLLAKKQGTVIWSSPIRKGGGPDVVARNVPDRSEDLINKCADACESIIPYVSWDDDLFEGLGPYKFGMSQQEIGEMCEFYPEQGKVQSGAEYRYARVWGLAVDSVPYFIDIPPDRGLGGGVHAFRSDLGFQFFNDKLFQICLSGWCEGDDTPLQSPKTRTPSNIKKWHSQNRAFRVEQFKNLTRAVRGRLGKPLLEKDDLVQWASVTKNVLVFSPPIDRPLRAVKVDTSSPAALQELQKKWNAEGKSTKETFDKASRDAYHSLPCRCSIIREGTALILRDEALAPQSK
jgi:hypothetical protein